DPPITRVVVDMAGSREFDVLPSGNRLVLKLNDGTSRPATQPAVVAKAAPAATDATIEATSPATVELKLPTQPTEPAKQDQKIVESAPSRADVAASRFSHETETVPSANRPPFAASLAAKPAAINAALEQQQMVAQATVQVSGNSGVTNCTSGRYTGEP